MKSRPASVGFGARPRHRRAARVGVCACVPRSLRCVAPRMRRQRFKVCIGLSSPARACTPLRRHANADARVARNDRAKRVETSDRRGNTQQGRARAPGAAGDLVARLRARPCFMEQRRRRRSFTPGARGWRRSARGAAGGGGPVSGGRKGRGPERERRGVQYCAESGMSPALIRRRSERALAQTTQRRHFWTPVGDLRHHARARDAVLTREKCARGS